MISVEELRRRMDEAVASYRNDRRFAVRHEVERLLETGPPWWVPADTRSALEGLGIPIPDISSPAGRALGVIALPTGDARLVWVDAALHEGDDTPSHAAPKALSAEAAESVWYGARIAVRLYPYHWPLAPREDLRFRLLDLQGVPVDTVEPIRGQSLGLTGLVATWSLLSGRPAREPLVFTGALGYADRLREAPIVEVEDLPAKREETARAGGRFVRPWERDVPALPPDEPVRTVAEALTAAFGPRWDAPKQCRRPPHFDAALALESLDLAYRRNGDGLRWSELGERFEALCADGTLPQPQKALALARAGACWTHVNDVPRALRSLEEALAIVESAGPNAVEGETELRVRTHLANAYRSEYRFAEAEAMARTSVSLGESLRLHRDAIKARSTLGQIFVVVGRTEAGLRYVAFARDFFDASRSPECVRSHTYVVQALARAGRLEEARREHALGLEHIAARSEPQHRRSDRAYLDYALLDGELRGLRRQPVDSGWVALAEAASRALEGLAAPWPRLGLQRVHDAAALRLARGDSSRERVLDRARRDADRWCERPILAWHAALVLVEAALVELERSGDERMARTYLAEALARFPGAHARSFFAPHLDPLHSTVSPPSIRGLLAAEPN